MLTKAVWLANNNKNTNARREAAAAGWRDNENDGSQINIVSTGGSLEVREMDMKFGDREITNGEGKDEEYGWSGSRAAMSATTVV